LNLKKIGNYCNIHELRQVLGGTANKRAGIWGFEFFVREKTPFKNLRTKKRARNG
jgi:hypothetical protein